MVPEALDIAYSFLISKYSDPELKPLCRELLSAAGLRKHPFCAASAPLGYEQAQEKLAVLNEKGTHRKAKGVYYSPMDVVHFILRNCVKSSCSLLTPENIADSSVSQIPVKAFCTQKTVFDPTCGSGGFLLAALNLKLDLLIGSGCVLTRRTVRRVVGTICGNDSNKESVAITKIRLLLCVLEKCGASFVPGLSSVLARSFESYDYVLDAHKSKKTYDMIVGNPPYVEDGKSGLSLDKKYGNIYANVLLNAANQLNPGGSMGFIVPLSYISTPRMRQLRRELFQRLPEQYILSYADRPDCLFGSVHQKLCIIIGNAAAQQQRIYTGNYQYWYKEERADLFDRTTVIQNNYQTDSYIPKLGTKMDEAVFAKVTDSKRLHSVYAASRVGTQSVFLNRRETFWMKAYREFCDDPEYKVFHYPTAAEADYCYCLINSSLFWWYWICVSDCWHVSKELNGFMAPPNPDGPLATRLASQLILRLEETKEYVGTAQTEYAYKHRLCLKEIQAIDDFVNRLYGLTAEESHYIKNFALKYRTSGGA